MIDAVEITTPTEDTFNPNTGLIEPVDDTVVYSGPARIRMPTGTEMESVFGERQVTRLRFMVDLPHDVTGVAIGDAVTVTESDDASALTRTFSVVAIPSETFNLYRPIGCEVAE